MKVFIILGNGFTIDFLTTFGFQQKIDVNNLFKYGSHVKWPCDNESGFLSFKHCPNLWTLGARPHMDQDSAMKLIEDIITCANVLASSQSIKPKKGVPNQVNTFIFAYKELLQYLKYLFVHYDNCVPESGIKIDNWKWGKYFKKLNSNPDIDEVIVVTYNYDIWLEKTLKLCGINFGILPFESNKFNLKFKIFKPHGSISFTHKIINEKPAYSIKYNYELLDGKLADFEVAYENLDGNYALTALIPPAGESGRFKYTWANQIRTDVVSLAKKIKKNDQVLICGISYWHVDRAELDELFMNFDDDINLRIINPSIDRTLNAVITSLFKNYILYDSCDMLEE